VETSLAITRAALCQGTAFSRAERLLNDLGLSEIDVLRHD
jgi:hypothetical protein